MYIVCGVFRTKYQPILIQYVPFEKKRELGYKISRLKFSEL